MAQLQLLIELRCVQCDNVLVVNGIHTDKDGCFAYIEPCEECAAEQSVHLTLCERRLFLDGSLPQSAGNAIRWADTL